jgi:hypothetical protein
MKNKGDTKLITKVFLVGTIIAILGYLFHPDVGQLSIIVNGEPVAEPLTHFAAIPTFLVLIGLAIALTLLLFMGIGVFMFFGALFFAVMVCFILAPYYWPVLVIIFMIIVVMSFGHEKK